MIDSTILSKFILKEPNWQMTKEYLLNAKSLDIAVTETCLSIIKAFRDGLISLDDARKKFEALKKLIGVNIVLSDHMDLINDAFEIALTENISLRNALYVSLVIKENDSMVTADLALKEILDNIGMKAVFIE